MPIWNNSSLAVGAALLSLIATNANSQAAYDESVGEQYEFAAVTSRAGGVCSPKVSVRFVDHGFRVENVEDPSQIITKKPTYGIVGAFTLYRGVNFRVRDSGTGCGRKRDVTVTWNSQTVIYMPHVSKIGACRYDLMLHHEMEHLRIFLQVPRDFEKQIAKLAATSSNPQQALRNFQPTITAETRRRNDQFHAFERQEPRRLCSSSQSPSSWSNRTW